MQTTSNNVTQKTDRVIFAKTRSGLDLPVIDVTNPRFAVADDQESLEAQQRAFLAWYRDRQRIPQWITKLLLRLAARRSPLVRALFHSEQGFLDSLSTYVLKLGVDNLPSGYDGPVDRKIAASPHVTLLRLRMQQIAKFLAEALTEALAAAPEAPLHFINIAGGPALDSVNAVILLSRSPRNLLNRPIVIHVLDAHDDGPLFGANAVDALKQGGPLRGLDVTIEYHAYNWNQTEPLERLLEYLQSIGALVAASSEGGLFEYGSDEAIIANLRALRTSVKFVAGSVTSASDLRKEMIAATKFKIVPRGIDGFAPLAAQAGYTIAKREPAVLSDQVLLR